MSLLNIIINLRLSNFHYQQILMVKPIDILDYGYYVLINI